MLRVIVHFASHDLSVTRASVLNSNALGNMLGSPVVGVRPQWLAALYEGETTH